MLLVLFSNASLLYHEREQINCEDKRMLCKVTHFYTFSLEIARKKKHKTFFLNVSILCFQGHYENTQFQPRKIYSFHSMEKG